MPFLYIDVGEKVCPVAICDHCGQRIHRADEGNVEWQKGTALCLTHKGECSRAFYHAKQADGGALVMSDDLDFFVANLVQNLGITLESAKLTKRKRDLLDPTK